MENSTVKGTSISSTIFTFEQYLLTLVPSCVIYVAVSTFGIISNIINIRTFVAMGLKDAMTVSFLLLSVSDCTFSVVSLALGIASALFVMETWTDVWLPIEPYIVGLFSANLFIPLSAVVALNTSFISVARCMCVSLPFQFKHVFKSETSIIFMSTSFVFCALMYVPVFTYMGVINKFDPVHNRSRPSAWVSPAREFLRDIVWNILGLAIPISTFAVIIVSTVIMAHALTKSTNFRSANAHGYGTSGTKTADISKIKEKYPKKTTGKLSGKEREIVKQVLLISLVYIMCNTPKILFIIAGVIVPEFSLNGRLGYLFLSVSSIRMMFEAFHPAISLPIYYTYNSKFKANCFM